MSKQYKAKREISFASFIKLAISLLVIVAVFVVGIIVVMTGWKVDTTENGVEVYFNKITKNCFVGSYLWNGNSENTIIDVPDEYENYKVSSLGGIYGRGVPVNFSVVMPDEFLEGIESVSNEGDDFEETTYTFTVKLGNNIKTLTNFIYEDYYYDEDASVRFKVKMHYECSPDNKWIYSQDGKLYDKKTNEMIY